MKKTISIFTFLFLSIPFYSQIEKGTKMIGLRFNIYQTKQENKNLISSAGNDYKNSGYNVALNGGYFIKNNLALGLLVSYAGQKTETIDKSINSDAYKNTNTNNSGIYSFGIYARLYKMLWENRIGFFGNLNAYYSFGKSATQYTQISNGIVQSDQKSEGDISGYSLAISPGVAYFITKRIGLEASFGNLMYSSQTTKTSSAGTSQSENKSSGLNFNFSANTFVLGLNFYFSSKKE